MRPCTGTIWPRSQEGLKMLLLVGCHCGCFVTDIKPTETPVGQPENDNRLSRPISLMNFPRERAGILRKQRGHKYPLPFFNYVVSYLRSLCHFSLGGLWVCKSSRRVPPVSLSLLFGMNKYRKCAEMPVPGRFLYNHVILKLVLVPSIGKVLTAFLHLQNAMPRFRIPRHGASSWCINYFLPDIKQVCMACSHLLSRGHIPPNSEL